MRTEVVGDWGTRNVSGKVGPLLGSLVFFVVAPGAVAGWVPYLLSEWRIQPPLLGVSGGRVVGGLLAAFGVAILVECFCVSRVKGVELQHRSRRLRRSLFPASIGMFGIRCTLLCWL